MAGRKEMAECRVRYETQAIKGKLIPIEAWIEVRVMCRAEGYAMVRRKGAMPFVVFEKDLRPIEKGRPA